MSVVRLPRLTPEEACKFVSARLVQLGLPRACLTEAAWAQLIAHCRGVPRLLLGVLGLALFVASEEHAACVTGSHVEEAVQARGGSPEAVAAKPTQDELDFSEERLPAVVPGAKGTSTDTGLDLVGRPPPAGRIPPRVVAGLYLAMVVAAYAVPTAAWLTWSMHRHRDKLAASDIEAPAMVVAQMSLATHAGTEQVAAVAGTTARAGAPAVETGSVRQGTAGVESPAQSASPAPVIVARGPDNAALENTAPESEAPATAIVAMASPPSGELPPATPPTPTGHDGVPPSPPLGPVLSEGLPSAPGRSATSTDASGTGQLGASVGIADRSDLDAKIEHRPPRAAAPAPEGHRVQTQTKELSDRSGPASWHETGGHVQAAQNPYHKVPMAGHQALPPGPLPRAIFVQRPTIIHMSLPVRQLLSARQALAESNSSAARGLLEAAQTTIVFEAGAAPGRSGIAVGQITNALSLLNSGSTMRALYYLDRAILALQPTS